MDVVSGRGREHQSLCALSLGGCGDKGLVASDTGSSHDLNSTTPIDGCYRGYRTYSVSIWQYIRHIIFAGGKGRTSYDPREHVTHAR